MSIIRRHHCPHTTKDRCRRVLGREGHFGVVSPQAFCDRVHFRPVLRVGFTKTSLGMYILLYLLCTHAIPHVAHTRVFLFLKTHQTTQDRVISWIDARTRSVLTCTTCSTIRERTRRARCAFEGTDSTSCRNWTRTRCDGFFRRLDPCSRYRPYRRTCGDSR